MADISDIIASLKNIEAKIVEVAEKEKAIVLKLVQSAETFIDNCKKVQDEKENK